MQYTVMKRMASVLFILIVLYLLSSIALYFYQEKLIFFPPSPINDVYQSVSKNEIELLINHQKIRGWKIKGDSNQHKIILYFGGNAEDVVYFNFEAEKINAREYITFNYAGYGDSEGQPSQHIFYENAVNIYDAMISQYKINPDNIIIVGRSLGSSVATYLASQRKVSGLILITPFDSIEKMAANRFKVFPIKLIIKHPFPTIKYITQVTAPILMLSAVQDEIIPAENLKNLKQKIGKKSSYVDYKNIGHNTIQQHSNYYSDINKFIGSVKSSVPIL